MYAHFAYLDFILEKLKSLLMYKIFNEAISKNIVHP